MNVRRAVISIALTFLFGPGAGHLYLGRIKKALVLFGITFFAALLFVLEAVKTVAKGDLSGINAANLLRDYSLAHPTAGFCFDAVFAAIWAYAFVDAFFKSQPEDFLNAKNNP